LTREDLKKWLEQQNSFGKFAWYEPLKTKTGAEDRGTFDCIFNKVRTGGKLRFDQDIVFYNSQNESQFEAHIWYFSTHAC
jgi:hypothetical protein